MSQNPLESISNNLKAIKDVYTQIDATVKTVDQTMTLAESTIMDLRAKQKLSLQQLDAANQQTKLLQKNVDEISASRSGILEENRQLKVKLEDAETALKKAKEESTTLSNEIKSVRDQLNVCRDELRKLKS